MCISCSGFTISIFSGIMIFLFGIVVYILYTVFLYNNLPLLTLIPSSLKTDLIFLHALCDCSKIFSHDLNHSYFFHFSSFWGENTF